MREVQCKVGKTGGRVHPERLSQDKRFTRGIIRGLKRVLMKWLIRWLLKRGSKGGQCDFSVSPSPFGLDFGTLGLRTRA